MEYIAYSVIGLVLGAIIAPSIIFLVHKFGVMEVDTSDPEKDKYNLIITKPIDKIRKKRFILLKIRISQKKHSV